MAVQYEGYHPVGVDITASLCAPLAWRPTLQDYPSKYYHPQADKALPAVIMGVVGKTGSINSQRLALARDLIRVESDDPSQTALQIKLLKKTARKLQDDEIAILDAGFKISQVLAAGIDRYVIRLAKNFTARRNKVMTYKGRGAPPKYGEWVRPLAPLARSYNDHEIAATPPDQVATWEEDERTIKAEIWKDLILPGKILSPKNKTFDVIAIYDPAYKKPWLLVSSVTLEAKSVKALYQDR